MSKVKYTQNQHAILFDCPGCGCMHMVWIKQPEGGKYPIWGFNGDLERPTITPSVLVRSGHFVPGKQNDNCWCKYNAEKIAKGESPSGFSCTICHSFITDGKIQFLSDCTHGLAGKTVELPDFDA